MWQIFEINIFIDVLCVDKMHTMLIWMKYDLTKEKKCFPCHKNYSNVLYYFFDSDAFYAFGFLPPKVLNEKKFLMGSK